MNGGGDDPGPENDSDAVEGPSTSRDDGRPVDRGGGATDVYDFGPGESPGIGVVTAVAAETGQDPTSLEPLYDAVDPDAIAGLVGKRAVEPGDQPIRVTFAYVGFTVTVESTGRILLAR